MILGDILCVWTLLGFLPSVWLVVEIDDEWSRRTMSIHNIFLFILFGPFGVFVLFLYLMMLIIAHTIEGINNLIKIIEGNKNGK